MGTCTFELRPYQKHAASWMVNNRVGNLWADMGTGKTIITLYALEQLARMTVPGVVAKGARRRVGFTRALIITKSRLANVTWPEECNPEKWPFLQTISVTAIKGTPEEREALLEKATSENEVHTISFELIPWLIDRYTVVTETRDTMGRLKTSLRVDWPYPIIIVDESTGLKNLRMKGGGKRVAGLLNIMPHVRRWYNLTGTPAPNNYESLWGQQWFIDTIRKKYVPNASYVLGPSYTKFKELYFELHRTLHYAMRLKPGAEEKIGRLLAPYVHRVSADHELDPSEILIEKHGFELPEDSLRLHKALVKKSRSLNNYITPSGSVLTPANYACALAQANQICSGFVYLDKSPIDEGPDRYEELHDIKIQMLRDYVENHSGSPVLVAHSHVADRRRIMNSPLFRDMVVRYIGDRSDTISRWNDGKIPVLLLNPMSAGHGLNLQFGGHHLVFFSIDWNAETHYQTIQRIGPARQIQSGFDRIVSVTYFIAAGTIEEVIYDTLIHKRDKQEALKAYVEGL
jgi:SNF2 family DNA or RNA helicase